MLKLYNIQKFNTESPFLNVTSQMLRHLKISRNPDPFFSVEYHGSNYSTTVAPGLVHVYNVRFNPAEKRDYEYRIEFVNDTEIFAVPVIGEKANYFYYTIIIRIIYYTYNAIIVHM